MQWPLGGTAFRLLPLDEPALRIEIAREGGRQFLFGAFVVACGRQHVAQHMIERIR